MQIISTFYEGNFQQKAFIINIVQRLRMSTMLMLMSKCEPAFSRLKICPVLPVPCKCKVEPCKFLSVQKFVQAPVNVAFKNLHVGCFNFLLEACVCRTFYKLIFIMTVVTVFYNNQYTRKIHSVRYCSQWKSIPIGNEKDPKFIFLNKNISHLVSVALKIFEV